jgi:hypothetical protein
MICCEMLSQPSYGYLFVVGLFKIYSLSKSQVCRTVLLTIVTMQ